MDKVEARLDRKSTKITAMANRKWTPLVYRCISSPDLEIPQKLEDFHSSYGRKGENVETRYSIRRLNAALLRFMENQPSDGCKNPDQGEYSKEGSAERRMGTEPIRSTDGPTDRAHGTPAKAEAPVCLQGSGPGQLEFGRSQRQSHLATPDKPSFSRASAAGVTQTQDCAAPAVARQQSGEMDTQGDSRQPDSEGTLKDSEQPFDKSTNLVSSGPRCSVVADEVDSRTVTLKIELGSTPVLRSDYLTDQKEREKEKKRKMKEAGIEIEVKKKQKYVEDHHDDCGEDLSAIGGLSEETAVMWNDRCSYEDNWSDASTDADEFEDYLFMDYNDKSLNTLMLFFVQCNPSISVRAFHAQNTRQLLLVAKTKSSYYDLAEMCGGEGRTSVLSIRMNLKSGENFDIVTGTDLNVPIEQRNVRQYFTDNTVLVVVMAPMCAPFGPMGQFNEHKYPTGWTRSYNLAAPHGRFCGEIALLQLRKKLHFIREQPDPTNLDKEFPWPDVIAYPGVTKQLWDRCRTGLVFHNKPCRKTSAMLGSCPEIVAPFKNMRCNCKVQHAQACGDGSQALQLWTWEEAQLVVAGIIAVKKLYQERQHYCAAYNIYYPTVGSGPSDPPAPKAKGRPKKAPEEPEWKMCKGCVRGRRADDSDHALDNKGVRNPHCRHIGKEIDIWYPKCPGCKDPRKPRDVGGKDGHTYVPNECRWAPETFIPRDRPTGSIVGTSRKGKHPREPRIPASAEPTAGASAHGHGEDGNAELGKDDEEAAKQLPKSTCLPEQPGEDESTSAGGSSSSTASRKEVDKKEGPVLDDAKVGDDPTDWTNFDIGGVLRALNLSTDAARRRILRKLHLRWWHASKKSMKRLLEQAGCGKEILLLIDPIVDTCKSCRAWSRPHPKNAASVHVAGEFNEQVEGDIFFYASAKIFHCIDRATRWHAAIIVPERKDEALIKALDTCWVGIHGPMKEYIMDGEKGLMRSHDAQQYFRKHGITSVQKAVKQHAQHIERRGGLLALQLGRMDTQLQEEGILREIPLEYRLRDAVFAGNALITTGDTTPYNAVYGRVPRILPNLPNSVQYDAVDGESSENILPGLIRHSHRLREIAVQRIVEATAAARVDEALNTQTRPAIQHFDFQVGDQVEFFEQPTIKHTSGWHGPATIIDMTHATRGSIRIRFLQDYKTVRAGNIRRWMAFLIHFLSYGATHACSVARDVVVGAVNHMNAGRVLLIGWTKYSLHDNWRWAKQTRQYLRVFNAAMKMARDSYHLTNCVAVRMGKGVYKIPGIECYSNSLVIYWTSDNPHGIKHFEATSHHSIDLSWVVNVNNEQRRSPQLLFVQYLLVTRDVVDMPKPDLDNMEVHDSQSDSSSSVPTPLPQIGGALTPIPEEESDEGEQYFIHDEPDLRYACAIANHYCMEDCVSHRLEEPEPSDVWDCFLSNSPPPQRVEDRPIEITANYHVRMANKRANLKEDYYVDYTEDDGVYVEFSGPARNFVAGTGPVEEGWCVVMALVVMQVYRTAQVEAKKKAVIERDTDVLTPEELVKHKDEVAAAVLKELQTWRKYNCFSRKARCNAQNIIDTRWVFKWKYEALPSGEKRRIIRARLTVRGFKDRDKGTLGTYAGTAQRYSQRIVVSEAVVHGWDLCTADVEKAFLQGVTYEELAKQTGEPVREVNFYLPAASIPFLRQVEGFENFNPFLEVLHCDKPGTGLIDAPRCFSMKLSQVTKLQCQLLPTSVDGELVAKHVNRQLVALMSKHVDDLKATGEKAHVDHVFAKIKELFG
ncbi:MAG: hypothetical protein CMJ88_11970, partial [Planctomycetes bacterium]|nr:hypothetical protein [Planctomycetota bacterium]